MSAFDARQALLTVSEMYTADHQAMAADIPGIALMEAAGRAACDAIVQRWSPRPVVVLCGPGNNGGDGFVVARLLAQAGWPVRVALLGAREALKDDAAISAARWEGPVEALASSSVEGAGLVVDGLFGAGLSRDIEGAAAEALGAIDVPCVALDVPSGVDGDTGAICGFAPRATLTVTFCRAKPGHLLLPGRDRCGELVVADIGIADEIVTRLAPATFRNGAALWKELFPWPVSSDHKYARGHLIVAGGGALASGAARLAARAGLRVGAGLVTLAIPPEAATVYAAHLTAVMLRADPTPADFANLIGEPRVTAVILGPGQGATAATRGRVLATLESGKPVVLDADAITAFAQRPYELLDRLHDRCVLTPHEGELRRLFELDGTRLERARAAARESGAVVVLKGSDTVVAAPDGVAVINDNAPPDLATAGSGDVLAGLVGGLMAQGVVPVTAAAMGVWLHGEAGRAAGPGLIAEDLTETLPAVLSRLKVMER